MRRKPNPSSAIATEPRRFLRRLVPLLAAIALLMILTPAALGSYRFDRQWGTLGSGAGQFNSPWGIGVDSSGNVYVADGDNYRVEKFDSSGNFISAWGWGVDDGAEEYQICTSSCQAGIRGSDDGQFFNSTGVAVDSSDNVYVGDHGLGERVEKFDSSGNFIANVGGPDHLGGATGLATDPSNNLYVANLNQHVVKFGSGGSFVTSWGGFGFADGLFIDPYSVVTNSSGTTVYVSDRNRVQQFSPSGAYQSKWSGGALSLAADSLDNVYLAADHIEALEPSGNLLWASRAGEFGRLYGIAFDSSDDMYLVDRSNNWVRRYQLGTADPETMVTSGPTGVINDETPTFTYTSSDLDTTLACKVDSAAYAPCNSGTLTTQRLAEGAHTFYVRATDSLGHTDPTPASRAFTVQTAAVSRSGSTVVVTAAPGSSDSFKIALSASPPTLIVQDFQDPPYPGSGEHAGPGCTRTGDRTVKCAAGGVTKIQVTAGDQADQVLNRTGLPSSLFGGLGADSLSGSTGVDVLTGGPGVDAMAGQKGNDQLLARDLTSDAAIDCGAGSDKADLDQLPKDPNSVITGCETKPRH